jgi:hypothetical protein
LEGKEYERLFGLMLKHKYIDVNEHERLQFDTWTQIKVKEIIEKYLGARNQKDRSGVAIIG